MCYISMAMRTVIDPKNMASLNIRAFFTTKPFHDANARLHHSLARELNISEDNIYLPVQKHTDRVQVVESPSDPVIADAVITSRKKLLIGVLVADCVPVLIYDPENEVVGAVHAGWRGTATEILRNTINAMGQKYGSVPEDILIAIGPCIRQCSYEVDGSVKEAVQSVTGEGDYYVRRGDKYMIDLSAANKVQAISSGIQNENIWQSADCTFCNPDRFYSYRYSKGLVSGRQGAFIGMW